MFTPGLSFLTFLARGPMSHLRGVILALAGELGTGGVDLGVDAAACCSFMKSANCEVGFELHQLRNEMASKLRTGASDQGNSEIACN